MLEVLVVYLPAVLTPSLTLNAATSWFAILLRGLSQAWDGASTGLVVSERLVNCPPQLAPPLVKALFDEISAAAKSKVCSALEFRCKHPVTTSF